MNGSFFLRLHGPSIETGSCRVNAQGLLARFGDRSFGSLAHLWPGSRGLRGFRVLEEGNNYLDSQEDFVLDSLRFKGEPLLVHTGILTTRSFQLTHRNRRRRLILLSEFPFLHGAGIFYLPSPSEKTSQGRARLTLSCPSNPCPRQPGAGVRHSPRGKKMGREGGWRRLAKSPCERNPAPGYRAG
jgi:hypothetical protein